MPERDEVDRGRESVPMAVFDAHSGLILRVGVVQRRALHRQSTASNEVVVEGKFDDATQMFAFGADGYAVVDRPPALATSDDVNAECRKRILGRYPFEDQFNAMRGADEVDFGWIEAVRGAGRVLKALNPIPADFADDRHWPARHGG